MSGPCPYVRATFVPHYAGDDQESGSGFWVCRAGDPALAITFDDLRHFGCLRGGHQACPGYLTHQRAPRGGDGY